MLLCLDREQPLIHSPLPLLLHHPVRRAKPLAAAWRLTEAEESPTHPTVRCCDRAAMRNCAFVVLAFTLALAPFPAFAQDAFEAASIKPNISMEGLSSIAEQPGGRIVATNIAPKVLIAYAYQVQTDQVLNGPSWLSSSRFDITAKAPTSLPLTSGPETGPASPWRLMMRTLLAERFQLIVHSEARELPIYNLVMARRDRRLGPRLQRSTTNCSTPAPLQPGATPPNPSTPPPCGMRLGPGLLSSNGRTLAQLAGTLAQFVGRPVEDRTGMEGGFNVELNWRYEPPPNANAAQLAAPVDLSAPILFTALQEQLGLRLVSGRAPLDVMVVDRVMVPLPD